MMKAFNMTQTDISLLFIYFYSVAICQDDFPPAHHVWHREPVSKMTKGFGLNTVE